MDSCRLDREGDAICGLVVDTSGNLRLNAADWKCWCGNVGQFSINLDLGLLEAHCGG